MSEEEIIKQTEIYINLLVEERKYGTASIEQIRFQETIQGLLDLYNKEKEKNKEYERQLDLDYVDENFISKDKIREKIEEYKKYDNGINYENEISILQELLEGE